jgi:cytochrome c-type biogenesis protein CcmH
MLKYLEKTGIRTRQGLINQTAPEDRINSRVKAFLVLVFILVAAVLSVGTAAAQDTPPGRPVTDDEVNQIAKQLYCPVCENIPLDVCPTQACVEWRELIRDLLAEGRDEAYIKAYFVNRFGDRVLSTPPARGLNWLVYIIPPLAILAGAFILFRGFKAWKSAAPPLPAQGPTPGADDEYVRRLEEELKKR